MIKLIDFMINETEHKIIKPPYVLHYSIHTIKNEQAGNSVEELIELAKKNNLRAFEIVESGKDLVVARFDGQEIETIEELEKS